MVATRHGTNTDPPELPQKELGPDVVDPFFNDQISMTSNEYGAIAAGDFSEGPRNYEIDDVLTEEMLSRVAYPRPSISFSPGRRTSTSRATATSCSESERGSNGTTENDLIDVDPTRRCRPSPRSHSPP